MNPLQENNVTIPSSVEGRICGYTKERMLSEIEAFHGFVAPGLVIGAIMVDWIQERLGPMVEADAVVETYHCLPDAVQIFTPCTIGNGWLKVLDWDQFAMTLYDRFTLKGYRVWLDPVKLKAAPPVHDWYMRIRPKKDLSRDILIPAILNAGRDIISLLPVEMTRFHTRKKKGTVGICPKCGEAYAKTAGDQCSSCGGEGYYRIVD